MRKRSRVLSVLLVAFAIVPALAAAQMPVSVSGELAFRDKYLFAGIPFAEKQVQQAQLSVGLGSVTVYGFTVWDFDRSEITEGDIYADYYAQLTPLVGFYVGGALYNFNYGEDFGGWEGTQEVYAGVTLGVPLAPTVTVAHDFDLGDGTHVTASVSHSVPLGASGLSLDLAANADYNAEYYTTESGLAFADASVSVGFPVGPATIAPIFLVQRRLDDAFEAFIPNEEVFGVTASFTF